MARYEAPQRAVTAARYLGDYKVWLAFDDGRTGVVDLADDLCGDALEPLRDTQRFAQFHLDAGAGGLAWHGGADFAANLLYERLSSVH
jgi:hypothetical protein